MLRRCALKSDQLPTCVTEVWAYEEGAAAPSAKEPEQVHLVLVYRHGGEWDQLYGRFIWLLRSLNELKQLKGSRVLDARRTANRSCSASGAEGAGGAAAREGLGGDDGLISLEDLVAMNAAYQRPVDALDDALRAHSKKFDAAGASPPARGRGAGAGAGAAPPGGVDDDSLIISEIVNTADASFFRRWVSTLDWDMCESASDAIHTPPCKGCQEHITSSLLLGGLSGVRIRDLLWRGEEAAARISSSRTLRGRPVCQLWARREGGGSGAPEGIEASLRRLLRLGC